MTDKDEARERLMDAFFGDGEEIYVRARYVEKTDLVTLGFYRDMEDWTASLEVSMDDALVAALLADLYWAIPTGDRQIAVAKRVEAFLDQWGEEEDA